MVTSNSNMKKVLVFCYLIISFHGFAQQNVFSSFTKITPQNGLASINVRKIIQDKYGFTWFASQGGLSRYDGNNFINYSLSSENILHKLLNNDVADISISSDSLYLFAITPYGGISIINITTGNVINSQLLNKLNDSSSITITKCIPDKNILYISTDEGFLLMYDYKKAKIIKSVFFSVGNNLSYNLSNFALLNNKLYVFLSNGQIIIYNKNLENIVNKISLISSSEPVIQVNQIRQLDSMCIVATSKGICFFSPYKNERVKNLYGLPAITSFPEGVNCSDIDISNDYLVFISSAGLYRYNRKSKVLAKILPSKNPENIKWFTEGKKILISGNGLWLSSTEGIAYIENISAPYTAYFKSFNNFKTEISHAYGLYAMNDTTVLASASDGVFKINCNNSNIERIYAGRNVNLIDKLNDKYFISSQTGKTFLIDNNYKEKSIDKIYPELSVLKSDMIISTLSINDSLILMGSDNSNGIYFWNPKKKSVKLINNTSKPLSLASSIINRLYQSKDKKQVFILCDNQISIFYPFENTIRHLNLNNPSTGSPLNIIMDICEFKGIFGLQYIIPEL